MKRFYSILIILFAVLCSWAQTESASDTLTGIIEPIPLPEITSQSARVTTDLLKKSSLFITQEDRRTVRSEVDDLSKRVNSILDEQKNKDPNMIEFRELDNMKRMWDIILGRAETAQSSLSGQAKKLEEERLILEDMMMRWNMTLTEAQQQDAPSTLIERINSTLSEISSFKKTVQDNSDFLLIQLDRLAGQIILVNQTLASINKNLAENNRDILSFDREPLWHELISKKDTSVSHIGALGVVQNSLDDIRELYSNFQLTLLINLILLVFILIIVIFLFTHLSRFISTDEDSLLISIRKLVNRPVSAGFLLGLAISFTLYGNAPGSIRTIIAILTLIPLAIIISDVLPPWFRRPVYLLIIMDVLIRIYNLGYQDSLISRLALLGVNTLLVLLLYWILGNKKSRIRIRETSFGKLKYYLLLISLALLGVAFFANILGGVLLSALLVSATIISIINTFLFYTLFLIAESLATILLKTRMMNTLNVVSKYFNTIHARFSRILSLAAIILWLVYTLRVFLINEPVFGWLGQTLSKSLKIGSLELTIWNLFAFFFIIWLTIWISRIVRYILEDEVMTRIEMRKGVPGAITLLVRLSLITVGFLVAIAATGVDMGSLAILLGALGVGIGFGLQNIFNNLVSGIILAFERPINEGDIIELGPLLGTVIEIGIRASKIKTYDGAEVIVPNGNLISNELINWTLADKKRRSEVLVGVAYGTDPQKVIDLLLGIVNEHEDVLKDPEPIALFTGFGESSLDFRLLFWIADADHRLRIQSKITVLINKAIRDAGIEIPFPQHDLHLRSGFTPSDGSIG